VVGFKSIAFYKLIWYSKTPLLNNFQSPISGEILMAKRRHLSNSANSLYQKAQSVFSHFQKKKEVKVFKINVVDTDSLMVKAKLSVSEEEQTFGLRSTYSDQEIRNIVKERIASLKTSALAA